MVVVNKKDSGASGLFQGDSVVPERNLLEIGTLIEGRAAGDGTVSIPFIYVWFFPMSWGKGVKDSRVQILFSMLQGIDMASLLICDVRL